MNKHTATFAGQTFTRNSKGRVYTHVVIARSSEAEGLRAARSPYYAEQDGKNYDFYAKDWHSNGTLQYSAYSYGGALVDGTRYDSAAAFLADWPEKQAYCEAMAARRLEDHEKRVTTGAFEKWHDLGWCGRLDLAEKKASSERGKAWAEVRVLPATLL